MIPVSPPIRNWSEEASANSIAVVRRIDPRHIVATRPRYSMPAGTSRRVDVREKYLLADWPVVNMWCAQTLIESAGEGEQREGQRAVAPQPAAREDRHDLGHHPEEGEEQT